MKKISLLLLSSGTWIASQGQNLDTLNNHVSGANLESGKFTSGWGYFAGHNMHAHEEFGEKYLINGHAHVLGVVAHITTSNGVISNPNLEIDFHLWGVDISGKPAGYGSKEDGHLLLGNANLDSSNVILFHKEAHVDDAFFVTMNLGDYAHHSLGGDTVGLYYTPHGSRTVTDINTVPFRNVYRVHSHGAPNWKDFYTESIAPNPIATHFALYPIVELENDHNSINQISKNGLHITGLYPNPALNEITCGFELKNKSKISMFLMNMNGQVLNAINETTVEKGVHQQRIDVSMLSSGMYILSVISSEGTVGMVFNKK